jgi:hypothetical protein
MTNRGFSQFELAKKGTAGRTLPSYYCISEWKIHSMPDFQKERTCYLAIAFSLMYQIFQIIYRRWMREGHTGAFVSFLNQNVYRLITSRWI